MNKLKEVFSHNDAAAKEVQKMCDQAIQPEQRWIPCSEGLPEDDEIVLVSDGIDYAVAFWRSDADAWDDPWHGWLDSFEFDVKAWMPLPELPIEKQQE